MSDKGLNFYSIEHEIALGKQLAQEVDRQAKFVNDPVVNEYVNRVGAEPGAQLGRAGALHNQGD